MLFFVFKRGVDLIILKVLNNNVVLTQDKNRIPVIVMGSGIAFQKRAGDKVEKEKIERIFKQDKSTNASAIEEAIKEIPPLYFDIANQILNFAQEKLDQKLDNNLFLALMDHIYFAVQRYKKGMLIPNKLQEEIKLLYKKEFKIGMVARNFINKNLNIELPEDEAGFIALHLVNANASADIDETIQVTNLIKEIVDLISKHLEMKLNVESLSYYRLVTHLKFFCISVVEKDVRPDLGMRDLYLMVKKSYPVSFKCVNLISELLLVKYNYVVNDDEKAYLAIHIERIRNES